MRAHLQHSQFNRLAIIDGVIGVILSLVAVALWASAQGGTTVAPASPDRRLTVGLVSALFGSIGGLALAARGTSRVF